MKIAGITGIPPRACRPRPASSPAEDRVELSGGFLDPLQKVDPARLSPLGDILQVPRESLQDELRLRQPGLRRSGLQHRRFREDLAELTRGKDLSPAELDRFGERWHRSAPLDPEQVTLLLEAYRDREAPGPLARFYQLSRDRDPQLVHYDIPREIYLRALNQLGRHAEAIQEGERLVEERLEQAGLGLARALEQPLPRQLQVSGEVLGSLAEAYRGIHRQAELTGCKLEGLLRQARLVKTESLRQALIGPGRVGRDALQRARDYQLQAFEADFEPEAGRALLHDELALGNLERAERLAPIVDYTLTRRGGVSDRPGLATRMELAALRQDRQAVERLLPRLLGGPPPEREATAAELGALARLLGSQHPSAAVLEQIQQRLGTESAPPAPGQEPSLRRRVTERLYQVGRTVEQALGSRFVAGSWRYVSRGGTVDMPVNRPTVQAYRRMLSCLGVDRLDRPQDAPEVCRRLHSFIDDQFQLVDRRDGSRPMEDLRSPVHYRRDRIAELRHDLCQSRASGSSHTNPHVELLFGQGDCRGTSINFALPFGIWKRDQQLGQLRAATAAALQGNAERSRDRLNRAREWDRMEILMVDLTFLGNLRLEKDAHGNPVKYRLLTDSSGRPMGAGDLLRGPDGKPQPIEDHSLPLLARLDEEGLVTELLAVDPFYRRFYPLGWRPVDPRGLLDEDKGLDLGPIGVAAADGAPIHVWGRPTSYSGSRPQPTPGECGHETFGGQPMAIGDPARLMGSPSAMDHLAEAMLGLVAAESKRELLQATTSARLEEATQGAHHRWYRARLADQRDPAQPFLGWAPERVVVEEELRSMEDDRLRQWLRSRGLGSGVSSAKLEAVRKAPAGTVLLDPVFQPQGRGVEAVEVLTLARYLEDLRYGEELGSTLTGLLRGWDGAELDRLERVHRLASLASRLGPEEPGEEPGVAWHALYELRPEQGIDPARWQSAAERVGSRPSPEQAVREVLESGRKDSAALDDLTLALYLSDYCGQETGVLQGLREGTDRRGLYQLSLLRHLARQASRLPAGPPVPAAEVRARLRACLEWLEAQLEKA